jgi:spore germination cell wall hydrolase CwlJ-like protein
MTLLKYGYAIMISVLLALSYTQSQELKVQLTQTQHQLDQTTGFIHKTFPDLKDADIQKMSYDVKQVDPKSLNCLAKNIYFEARDQSELGQIAVARVTVNRLSSDKYPNSVCEIVYQHCQFSWTCNRKERIISDKESWNKSVKIARIVLAFNSYQNVVKDATYYHVETIHPSWSKQMVKVGQVDDQIFYREKI